MKLIGKNQLVNGHFHAWTVYAPLGPKHVVWLVASLVVARVANYASVTAHIPWEVVHPPFTHKDIGLFLIRLGNFFARFLSIPLYWENAPELEYGTWQLKRGQISWDHIPTNILLCFDTGHAILGTSSVRQARQTIKDQFTQRKSQIKHLHIHENNGITDTHHTIGRVITPKLFSELTHGRTFIFEK